MSISVEGLKYAIKKITPNTNDVLLVGFKHRDDKRMPENELYEWQNALRTSGIPNVVVYNPYGGDIKFDVVALPEIEQKLKQIVKELDKS